MAATELSDTQITAASRLQHTPWCDEYKKMISGMLYDPMAPLLKQGKFDARKWCYTYNSTDPSTCSDFDDLLDKRLAQMREMLGSVGDGVCVEPPFTVDYGCNISFGKNVFVNFNMVVLDCALVQVGARTFFGPDVSIYTATHETEVQSRRDDIEYAKPVVIGEDCWIGGKVVILPGVTIGDGVTIAASSVVSKDIESWSVAMGIPAKVVKKVKPLEKLVENDVQIGRAASDAQHTGAA